MNQAKKLNPNMKVIRLWSIWMAAIIIGSFSILSFVLALVPMRFGERLNADHIMAITVYNPSHTHVIYPDRTNVVEHMHVLNEIMRKLERGRRTNRFVSTFFHGQTVQNVAAPGPISVDEISGNNDRHYLRIEFDRFNPQFSLSATGGSNITIGDANLNTNAQIMQIIIPLGSVERGFNRVTWYISTSADRNTQFNQRMTTYMNLWALAEYTRELNIPALQPAPPED